MFKAVPLSVGCARLFPEVTHVCVGISPFNGYFTAERIAQLAAWTKENFAQFHFFVPDEVTAYTLEALGYPPARAKHKAHRQSRHVHNKIATALTTLGVPDPRRRILGMAELRDMPVYHRMKSEVDELFEHDQDFRAACFDASTWVLRGKVDTEPTQHQLQLAVRYFLAELPLFAASGLITGNTTSMFIYHQRVSFLQRFFDNEFAFRPRQGQGFLIVREPVLEAANP